MRAKLPEAIDTPERGVQERLLRDIASTWDGELRTDPLWTFFDRRITVHAQGGCPMGPKDRAVTKPTGEVYGCEGLYVMDAAAFPGPVGANPSATIAAIAEYKVAKFIERSAEKRTPLLNSDALEGLPRALVRLEEEREEAVAWVEPTRQLLDPLGDLPSNSSSVEPAHKSVGIEFTERMEGATGTIDGEGRQSIETELTVRIDDLADYVARHARGVDVPIPIINGTLTIGNERELIREQKRASDPLEHSGGNGEPDPNWNLKPDESYIVVMARPGLDDRGNEIRTIDYRLVRHDGRIFKGEKTIRDDPGFDAWEDTTRLDIAEFNEKDEEVPGSKGELQLPAQAFFDMQLPSFKADTDDPARQIWAMATFGRFFFGHLAAVYLPELDRLGGLASNLMRRGHG